MNLNEKCDVIDVECEPVDALEVWRKIHDNYAVSNFGRVWSLKRNKLLHQYIETCNREGGVQYYYKTVSLYDCGNKKNYYVHRLIVHAFINDIRKIKNKHVKHINKIKMDNRAENLCVY